MDVSYLIGYVTAKKNMFKYTDGSPIWATPVNLEHRYLSIVIVLLD